MKRTITNWLKGRRKSVDTGITVVRAKELLGELDSSSRGNIHHYQRGNIFRYEKDRTYENISPQDAIDFLKRNHFSDECRAPFLVHVGLVHTTARYQAYSGKKDKRHYIDVTVGPGIFAIAVTGGRIKPSERVTIDILVKKENDVCEMPRTGKEAPYHVQRGGNQKC